MFPAAVLGWAFRPAGLQTHRPVGQGHVQT